jgi:hypothetical protein
VKCLKKELLNTVLKIECDKGQRTVKRFFYWFQDSDLPAEHVVKFYKNSVAFNGEFVAQSENTLNALCAFESWFRDNFAFRLGRFVHSACVLLNEMALLIAGDSGVGKTTLCYHLLKKGALYCSDELAQVNKGMIFPYPKPLYVRYDKNNFELRRVVFPKKVAPIEWYPVSTVVFPKKGKRDRIVLKSKAESLATLASLLLRDVITREDFECLKEIVIRAKCYDLEWECADCATCLIIDKSR